MAVVPPSERRSSSRPQTVASWPTSNSGIRRSPLVIHNHGGPSSRLEGRLLANGATSNGLRLVSVDRPGIGRSTPQKDRSYESWANDLLTIADALGYQEFGVSGWSEGGPWPLAAAAYLDPARLRHVTSIAGGNYGTFGDMWAAKFMDKIDTFGGQLALHHRFAVPPHVRNPRSRCQHFRKSYIKTLIKMVNGYDAKLLSDPAIAEAFADMSAECFAQGSEPLVDDAELLYRRWAFDVTQDRHDRCTCGRAPKTTSSRTRSTRRSRTACLGRCGTRSRVPVTSWRSARPTRSSPSPPRTCRAPPDDRQRPAGAGR